MSASDRDILVGAVSYHPRVVTIWERFRQYFAEAEVPTDYVLYSNYERLVDALIDGEVEVAWNTNTAFVAVERRLGERTRILGMRDLDAEFATVIVTRRGETFEDPGELEGRRLALGSRDSGHAAILPLYYLGEEDLDAEEACELVRFDSDLGKHGDTGGSELQVIEAVAGGSADAGAVGDSTWARFRAERVPAAAGLEIAWRSPTYNHCNFTALVSMEAERAERWQRALLAMDHDDPRDRQAMDLEGVRRWLPGERTGYESLFAALEGAPIPGRRSEADTEPG